MLNRKTIFTAMGGILLLVLALAGFVLRPPAESTGEIETIPLTIEDQSENEETDVESDDLIPTEEPDLADANLFHILQDNSGTEVRFSIDEILRNEPFTVVGVTSLVSGEILVDFENPENSQVGTILIDARSFLTDNSFRNRAIQNQILSTQNYPQIMFVPTQISGFPAASVDIGDTVLVQITGDLTIRDVTHSETFEVSITLVSETRIEGYGSVEILRNNYGLEIPSVPNVADVSNQVFLEIYFAAEK